MTARDAGGAGRPYTALVLAASRGARDPLAAAQRLSHKCLVRVGGEPMLLRVLRSLGASQRVGRIAISIDDPGALEAVPGLAPLLDWRSVAMVPSAATPSLSVARAVETLENPWPLLVTTADHPLLTPAMVDHFCAEAVSAEADLAVALAAASLVLARHPDARRTFLRVRGERYTGCNMFALMTPNAVRAADFWQALEAHRKRPWRIFKAFGAAAILRFAAGGMTLDAAMRAASRRLDLKAVAVEMPFPDAAIDVDKPDDLALAEAVLRAREEAGETSAMYSRPSWPNSKDQ